MEALAKAGRWAYAICLIGLAGQQLYYSDLRPVFVPAWASPIPGHALLAYLFSIILIGTATTLFVGKGVRIAMLLLAAFSLPCSFSVMRLLSCLSIRMAGRSGHGTML